MSKRLTRVNPHERAGHPVRGYTRHEQKPGEVWVLPEVKDAWWEDDDQDRASLPVKLIALLPVGLVILAILITIGSK